MGGSGLHSGASVRPCPIRSSFARCAASRSSARRCGSCARPGARCPSTARCASATRSSRSPSTPELCAEVTLQPVRRHGVDAAVLFADIMTPVLGMGIGVELVEGVGPVVEDADAERGRRRAAARAGCVAFEPVLEAVRIVRRELEPERALVGFCGGPFTVAGYLVEGRPSRDFVRVKELMYREPAVWHALLDRLTDTFCRLRRGEGGGRRGRDPALRLLGRRALRRRLRGVRRAVLGADPRRASMCRRSTSAPGRRTCSGRWPPPAATRSASTGASRSTRAGSPSARTAPCRATSTRPCSSARGRASRPPRSTSSPRPAAGPATSSTSATASCPGPIPTPGPAGRARSRAHREAAALTPPSS